MVLEPEALVDPSQDAAQPLSTEEQAELPHEEGFALNAETEALEGCLGWTFSNRALLQEALTHSTFANEDPNAGPNNERLEFLGDAVLDVLVASVLFQRPEMSDEGEMSRRRARVVRREALAVLARGLHLGCYLRVGEGQRRSGATDSILADAYEALAAAVFLDGGYEAVELCFGAVFRDAVEAAQERVDYKTQLQEYCHLKRIKAPRYTVVGVEGPGHAREYHCTVSVNGETLGSGQGPSKKSAEQDCARIALEGLN